MTTAYVTCPLCEATCGLEVTLDAATVTGVRGDRDDVFSHGYVCPKGASLGALHHDPDRLRTPLIRRGGELVEASWDEAFAEIDARLPGIIDANGRDAVAVYVGNPVSHNVSASVYLRALVKALRTTNVYTAGTVDQIPKHYSSGYLFGGAMTIPVPDLDRTEYLLVLGANPLVSNGSLMTAGDVRSRLRGIRDRGGRIVVVDPRRTRSAEFADEHHAIRPGADALLLLAMVHTLFAENLVRLGTLAGHVTGVDEVRELAAEFSPETVADATGLAAADIRRLARDLAAADRAAVYGRIGTTTQEFGTLTSWLVDVLNVLTGHLDREGCAMFPLAAAGQANTAPSKPFRAGRRRTRVRDLPEVLGEVPVATLADEIETPGDGQVRALITIAGNPCLSAPNAARLDAAVAGLDFMVSIDIYRNETTRHADVVLPAPSPLERPHYDVTLYQLAVRSVANWTPATLTSEIPQEWRTLLRLSGVIAGQGPDPDVDALDDLLAADLADRYGVTADDTRRGPERIVDLMLRAGPFDLTLADLEAAPHGVDLGPMQPRIPDVLATESGKVELAPEAIVSDIPRLAASLAGSAGSAPGSAGSDGQDTGRPTDLILIGRRQLSSNNSWMHNLEPLVRGSNRCTAQLHPDDAGRLGLVDGDPVTVTARTGSIDVPVEITDAMRPGVVSIPHGWGHDVAGVRTAVATRHSGANANVLTDDRTLDGPTGTAALGGIPVTLTPTR
ncbi:MULTISPECIES: molybdopterin-dependent oxidoreductase [Prauserella salsuginis group]|uniref:Molybdopterin-dependent oxidoreductase n=1 Tax=Prauserella salsuginis TaxID=387889 RepID=A0ABW6G0L4_9PSEU|nr:MULTISPECIES: molybdopterin-dependent oxidoreductase [Prauserella salsuginis group]MCR3721335.1 Anaerobic selenocysteine-containing dehydrogenase [Prauserella flava]MCR3734585.1 Anaerobic selenocysteine-containing dehydrogenase [Prauserella salsuginis]